MQEQASLVKRRMFMITELVLFAIRKGVEETHAQSAIILRVIL